MNDIKLFTKNEKELKNQIQAVRIYSQDKGIKFGMGKCAMLLTRHEKRNMTDRIGLLNQQINRMLSEKKTYKYLGTLEVDSIKQAEIKENIHKRLSQENKKVIQNQTIYQKSQ